MQRILHVTKVYNRSRFFPFKLIIGLYIPLIDFDTSLPVTWHTTSENARRGHWTFVQYCFSLSRLRFTSFSIKFLRITCVSHILRYVKRSLILFVLAKNSHPTLASVLNPSWTNSCLPSLLSTTSVCVLAISTAP